MSKKSLYVNNYAYFASQKTVLKSKVLCCEVHLVVNLVVMAVQQVVNLLVMAMQQAVNLVVMAVPQAVNLVVMAVQQAVNLVLMAVQQAPGDVLQAMDHDRLVLAAASVAPYQKIVESIVDVMELASSHDLTWQTQTPFGRLWSWSATKHHARQ